MSCALSPFTQIKQNNLLVRKARGFQQRLKILPINVPQGQNKIIWPVSTIIWQTYTLILRWFSRILFSRALLSTTLLPFHIFQGGLSELYIPSSTFLSRRVSMGCQKPVCLKAFSSPLLARFRKGSCSHTVSSPFIKSITSGSNTKKPPLIQAPAPTGFS